MAEANRAGQQAALLARNQFIEEDVGLASIEGGLRGLQIGLDVGNALKAQTEVKQVRSFQTVDVGSGSLLGFENITQEVAFTPGLDLSGIGSSFGIDLGF